MGCFLVPAHVAADDGEEHEIGSCSVRNVSMIGRAMLAGMRPPGQSIVGMTVAMLMLVRMGVQGSAMLWLLHVLCPCLALRQG